MYFQNQRPKLSIVAAFDRDESKVGRVIHGCPCHDISNLAPVVKDLNISVGVVAVPAFGAQAVADLLVDVGITGLLNFAPVRLRVPRQVYCEDIDITVSLEKVAYFSRLNLQQQGAVRQ
jgi:redox-sensing transcriptional repressor